MLLLIGVTFMILYKFFIFSLLIFISVNSVSQDKEKNKIELTLTPYFKHNVAYGLSDFCISLSKYGITYIPFSIVFKSETKFLASSGKSFIGEYEIFDLNKINFSELGSNLQCLTISINGGKEFSPFLFMDSLFVCNNFSVNGNEIRFYKDKQFNLAIKSYHDMFPFPERESCTLNFIKEIKVDLMSIDSELTIIDTDSMKSRMGIIVKEDSIDFETYNLLIIKNCSLQENKSKEFRKQYHQYKKQSEKFINKKEVILFPVSYSKLSYDSIANVRYLDVINTYSKTNFFDVERRGEFSGFIVLKSNSEGIKLKVKYIK